MRPPNVNPSTFPRPVDRPRGNVMKAYIRVDNIPSNSVLTTMLDLNVPDSCDISPFLDGISKALRYLPPEKFQGKNYQTITQTDKITKETCLYFAGFDK